MQSYAPLYCITLDSVSMQYGCMILWHVLSMCMKGHIHETIHDYVIDIKITFHNGLHWLYSHPFLVVHSTSYCLPVVHCSLSPLISDTCMPLTTSSHGVHVSIWLHVSCNPVSPMIVATSMIVIATSLRLEMLHVYLANEPWHFGLHSTLVTLVSSLIANQ